MASSRGIRAGRAFVELFADNSKLIRGLRLARQKLKAFGNHVRNLGLKITGLGAAMFAPLAASAKYFASYGDQVAKMSKRTGVSVETLSELQFVASQTGTEFAILENGFRKMQRSIYDAGRGLSTQTDALKDLGLTFKDLDGLSPEAQFKLLANQISKVEDPTRKAALAMSIFGRTGTNLLPMFTGGAAGIDTLQKKARKLGLTMSSEDAKAAEDFTDAMDSLWKVVKMGVFHIGAALAPALQQAAEAITNIAVKISTWIQQNQAVVVTVAKIIAGVVAAGIALAILGTAISGLGSIIGVVIGIVTAAITVFKILAAVIAFLVSPIGIVIAALGALGAYMVTSTQAGGKALTWLGEKFNVLKQDALAAFQGISDALAAGDLGLAMKILWLTLKMEWTRGVNFLEKAWLNFRNFFIRIGYDAWHGLLAVVAIVWNALEVGWIETTAFFAKAWNSFTGFFAKTWERIKSAAKKAWNWIKSLFDDSVDLEAENKLVEQEKQKAIAKIEDDKNRANAKREAKRQAERQRAETLHNATLAEIGKENMSKHKALDDEYAERIKSNEDDLTAARAEWKTALATARKKREDKEEADALAKPEDPDSILDKAKNALGNLGNIGDVVATQARKIGVKGTFNAAAIRGLQAGGAADRTAKATEQTAKNTKKLVQAAQTGGLKFT